MPSVHAVPATATSLTVPGKWCSSRVRVSCAFCAVAPDGTPVTLNFRYVTMVSPDSVPATSLVTVPSLYVGRALDVYASSDAPYVSTCVVVPAALALAANDVIPATTPVRTTAGSSAASTGRRTPRGWVVAWRLVTLRGLPWRWRQSRTR